MTPPRLQHTRFTRVRAIAPGLWLCALVAVGCAEPLSLTEVAGRYSLLRVGGDPLPVLWSGVGDAPVRILASRVELLADGSASTSTLVEELSGPGAPRTIEYGGTWLWKLDGNRVILRSPPCTAVLCAATIATSEWRIRGTTLISSGGWVYHRSGAAAL